MFVSNGWGQLEHLEQRFLWFMCTMTFVRVVFFYIRDGLRLDTFRGSLDDEFPSNNHLKKTTKVSQYGVNLLPANFLISL